MKKIVIILSVLISLSLIGNGILIGTVIRNHKQKEDKINVLDKQIADKENELTEANKKIEELNTSIHTLNGQVEDYRNQMDDYNNKECFYIETLDEKTMYVTEDTIYIDVADYDKIGGLTRSQGVTVVGQVTKYLGEDTHWYKIRLKDNSEAYVNAKYLADNKPIEVTVDNSGNAKVGDGTTTGKSQEQIDFEKKTQELINSGVLSAGGEHGTGGEAKFDDGGKTHVDLQLH